MGSSLATARQQQARERCAERDAAHAAWVVQTAPPAAVSALDGGVAACAAALASGAATSEGLTLAAIARTHRVGFALNAVTHERYADALDDARASDMRRARGAALGPLEGVPVSVKDVFEIGGLDTLQGCAARAGSVAAADGLVVSLLRSAGAVIVCKSNVPQLLMVPESDNFIFGRTLNPWDAARTPGGSSGGEGALVASRCVAAGVGTDIGGSIRHPAAFTGIVGFKPSPERVTRRGWPAPRGPDGSDGQHAILPAAGPLARCVADAAAIMRALLAPAAAVADPTVPALPFDEAAFAAPATRPLRIGRLDVDGFCAAAPPCARAVDDAATALTAAGHTVMDEPLLPAAEITAACFNYYALLGADGDLHEFKRGLEGEALHPVYALMDLGATMSAPLRWLVVAVLRALGMTRAADLLELARRRSARELWALVERRDAFKARLMQAMSAARLDALLAPALAVPAFLHGQSRDITPACAPAFIFNLVGFPAGVLPVPRRVDESECHYDAPLGQRDPCAAAMRAALAGAAGLPVAVQVVGLPLRDEHTLGVMAVVEAVLAREAGGRGGGGCPDAVLEATIAKLRGRA